MSKKNKSFLFTGSLRKFLRKAYALLPDHWKGLLLRRMVRLDFAPSERLTFKLAQTRDELEAAYKLLHDSYVSAGFMTPHPSGLRTTVYHALPTTSTLIAKWDDRVVGTVSIIRQNPLGLPLQNIFDLSHLEKDGGQVVEISSLAVHPEFRGKHGTVLFLLCKFLYDYCMEYFSIDYMAIAVNPRQRELYEQIMLFERLQEKTVKSYDFVNGAPAIGEVMDLRRAHNKLLKGYLNQQAHRNLFAFFMQTKKFANFHFPSRLFFKASDPVMTPELLDYFFNKKTKLFDSLSEMQKAALRGIYHNSHKHLEMLPQTNLVHKFFSRRKGSRFPVQCHATIVSNAGETLGEMQVLEVSEMGFRGTTSCHLEKYQAVAVKIIIGTHLSAEVEAEVVWVQEDGPIGFSLTAPAVEWSRLIQHLERDLKQDRNSLPQRRRWDRAGSKG